jgi:RNA polymerase sigma-54 factor
LREHLLQQAGCLRLSDRDRVLVETVVDAVDGSGYLAQPLDELTVLCRLDPPVEDDELRIALCHVQAFDPPGVGARSVAECLVLQLRALDPDAHPACELARRIVEHHLELLAAHDFQRLRRELGCDAQALQAATVLLRGLEPRPGADHAADDTQYVVADVIVHRVEGVWTASINPDARRMMPAKPTTTGSAPPDAKPARHNSNATTSPSADMKCQANRRTARARGFCVIGASTARIGRISRRSPK